MSSVGLQEKVDFPSRCSLEFIEGAIAFFEYIVSLLVFFRYCNLDGTNVVTAKIKSIDGLLGNFGMCPQPNLHKRFDDNRHELPGSISKETLIKILPFHREYR
jgi:hypothetical protein